MRLLVRGHDLPGRRFYDGETEHENVHVGLQVRRDVVDLIPGDAGTATWSAEATLARVEGELDVRGPPVHGRRGDRFVYLSWGDVDRKGGFTMFRRAKLMLNRIDPAVLRSLDEQSTLLADVHLTDSCGAPVRRRPRRRDHLERCSLPQQRLAARRQAVANREALGQAELPELCHQIGHGVEAGAPGFGERDVGRRRSSLWLRPEEAGPGSGSSSRQGRRRCRPCDPVGR